MNEPTEKRLYEIRREFFRCEMMARAICRISSDPDCPIEELQYKLMEIETIGEVLIDLIERSADEMEPILLKRHVEGLEEEANHDDL